jgi:hypothetical protein
VRVGCMSAFEHMADVGQTMRAMSAKGPSADVSRAPWACPPGAELRRKGSETGATLAVCCYYSHSHDCAAALLLSTGPVEQVDWANPIEGCSGYSDRISPA